MPVIELTLRTPVALDAIEPIATHVPEILVGAGTIVAPEQAKEALSAGAQFLVSPGTTDTLAAAMQDTGLPHLPGAATVSEVLRLLELGYSEMKFFPAEASGGADFLKSIGVARAAGAVLPDRRDHGVERGVVPLAAERRLRRRLLADPGRRAARRTTGTGSSGSPPRPPTSRADVDPGLVTEPPTRDRASAPSSGRRARPWETATISATTDSAISPGALPPVFSPAGTCSRASVAASSSASSASNTLSARRRLPIIATYPARPASACRSSASMPGVSWSHITNASASSSGCSASHCAGVRSTSSSGSSTVRRPAISRDRDDRAADRVVGDHHDLAVLRGVVGPGLLTVRAHGADPTAGWQTGRVILDGGLSNALVARGHDLSDDLWTAALLRDRPEEVAAVHRAYFAAGAEVATTASYQASVPGFERAGLSRAEAEALVRRSVTLAREVRDELAGDGRRRLVAASVGPYGAVLADGSEYRGRYGIGAARLRDFHLPRLELLVSAGPGPARRRDDPGPRRGGGARRPARRARACRPGCPTPAPATPPGPASRSPTRSRWSPAAPRSSPPG